MMLTACFKRGIDVSMYHETYFIFIITSCNNVVTAPKFVVLTRFPQSDSASQEEFLKEAGLMKRLKHENLLHLLGVCSLQKPIFIITEYMPLGNLLEYIR